MSTTVVEIPKSGLDIWLRWMGASLAAWMIVGVVSCCAPLAQVVAAMASPAWGAASTWVTNGLPLVAALGLAAAGFAAGAMQWIFLRRSLGLSGWWVLASGAGWLIVIALIAVVAVLFVALVVMQDSNSSGTTPGYFPLTPVLTTSLIVGLVSIAAFVPGLVLGISQWLVLRRHVQWAGWWIPATIAAWAWVGLLFAIPIPGWLLIPIVPPAIMGLVFVRLWRRPRAETGAETPPELAPHVTLETTSPNLLDLGLAGEAAPQGVGPEIQATAIRESGGEAMSTTAIEVGKSGPGIWLRWMGASLSAWVVVGVVSCCAALPGLVAMGTTSGEAGSSAVYILLASLALVLALAGLVVGAMQWLFLRRRIGLSGWWVLASGAGWLLALIAAATPLVALYLWAASRNFPVIPDPVGRLIGRLTVIAGPVLASLVLGTSQWLVLRRQVQRAGWWIPATIAALALGWIPAMPPWVLGDVVNPYLDLIPYLGLFLVALVAPAITGLVFAWLWRRPRAEAGAERPPGLAPPVAP